MKKGLLLSLALLSGFAARAQVDTIITNPGGTVKTCDMSTNQVVNRQTYPFSGIKSHIAYSADGSKIYFQDLSPYVNTGAWVEGEVRGDSIFVKSGQKVHHQDETETRMAIDVYLNAGGLKGSSIEPNDEPYIKMKVNRDGSISMPDGHGVVAMDQYGDILCRNYAYMFRPFDLATDTVIPPADAQDKQYSLNYKDNFGNEIYKLVNVRRNDATADIYIQGLAAYYAPGSWIRGKIKDDTAVFAARQYQGLSSDGQFFDFIYPGTRNQSADLGFDLDDSLIFSYDRDKDEFYSDQSVLETLGDRILLSNYDQPSLKPYTPHAAVPAAPVMKGYSDYSASGFIVLRFNIAPVDDNGDYIDPAGITWRLIVDGEPYTFKKDTYKWLGEDKEQFAWGEQDKVDIVFEACGLYNIWFYGNCKEVAAECTYTYNGESHTATSEPMAVSAEAGVAQASTGIAAVATEYHDLQGRRTLKPASGISLKTVTYSDGSKRTTKIMTNK